MFSTAKPVLAVANRSPSADYLATNLGNTLHIFHLSKDTIVTHKEDLNLTVELDLQVYQRVNLYDPRILRQLEGNHTYLEAVHSIDLKRALVYPQLAARVPEQQEFITSSLGFIREIHHLETDFIGISTIHSNSLPGLDNLGTLLTKSQIILISSKDNHKSKNQNNLKTLNKIQFQKKSQNSQRNLWKQNLKLRLQIYKP